MLIDMNRMQDADDEWKRLTKERIETVAAEFHREVEEDRMTVEAADSDHNRSDALRGFAGACNQYAWLVGNTIGDYQEAVKLSAESVRICQQLPEMKSNHAGCFDTLGRSYYGAGDVANAVKHQSMAVELSPASGQIRRQLEFFQKEAAERGVKVPAEEPVVVPAVKSAPVTTRP